MRTPFLPLAFVLVVAACGDDRADAPAARDAAPSAAGNLGPDPVVLRVARGGGRARAYAYPRLESPVWTSSGALPAPARVLGFDDRAGSLALVDERGLPSRLDLRAGGVSAASRTRLASLATADGTGIFGVAGGQVVRLTPTDQTPWTLRTRPAPREAVPQPDGSVLVVADGGEGTLVWRVRPPDDALADTAVLPRTRRAIPAGDAGRVYFVGDSTIAALRTRDLQPLPTVRLGAPIVAAVATPSGDRLFVALRDDAALRIVDQYQGSVTGEVELPGTATELRMDALGRYLLARAARGDSAWVVALGTGRVLGAVATAWRADLPMVLPDGLVAAARGDDVVLVDGETLQQRQQVAGGARDFWHLIFWSGFRPRDAARDRPVTFASRDTEPADTLATDSLAARGDSAAAADTAAPTIPVPATPAATPAPAAPRAAAAPDRGFVVQFASFPDPEKARAAAAAIDVNGRRPRVVEVRSSGTPVYRVVLGPFGTRADAEATGRESRRDFWVYEAKP